MPVAPTPIYHSDLRSFMRRTSSLMRPAQRRHRCLSNASSAEAFDERGAVDRGLQGQQTAFSIYPSERSRYARVLFYTSPRTSEDRD